MKNIVLFLGLSLSLSAYAQVVSETDSLEITVKIDDWNKAWKIKDNVLAAKWYSNDAEFTNAFGFSMIGRDAIEEYLGAVFKMDFVMAGDSEQTSLKLKRISDDAILAISTISRTGQKMSDDSELGPRRTTHHRLFKKEKAWRIVGHLISDARSTVSNKH
ncbi:MAG: hypothetical protein R3182_03445 [Draconibacterium sp.]|nr:hypothetical protein [Draconibacterium sp.]